MCLPRRVLLFFSNIGMGLEQLRPLASVHRCINLDLGKEAGIRRLGYFHLSGLLEEVSARLDDRLAEVFEQHLAQVLRRLLALLEQCLECLVDRPSVGVR